MRGNSPCRPPSADDLQKGARHGGRVVPADFPGDQAGVQDSPSQVPTEPNPRTWANRGGAWGFASPGQRPTGLSPYLVAQRVEQVGGDPSRWATRAMGDGALRADGQHKEARGQGSKPHENFHRERRPHAAPRRPQAKARHERRQEDRQKRRWAIGTSRRHFSRSGYDRRCVCRSPKRFSDEPACSNPTRTWPSDEEDDGDDADALSPQDQACANRKAHANRRWPFRR